MDAMRIPEGGSWSDQDDDSDELESLKPDEESEEERWDQELENARLAVLKRREENLAAKAQKRMTPHAAPSEDVKMTKQATPSGSKDEPAHSKKSAWGRCADKRKLSTDGAASGATAPPTCTADTPSAGLAAASSTDDAAAAAAPAV